MDNKGQMGMHMWGATDIFIILFGIIMGIGIMWYFRDASFIQNLICTVPPAP